MKLTKTKLKEIIKEEIELLKEDDEKIAEKGVAKMRGMLAQHNKSQFKKGNYITKRVDGVLYVVGNKGKGTVGIINKETGKLHFPSYPTKHLDILKPYKK